MDPILLTDLRVAVLLSVLLHIALLIVLVNVDVYIPQQHSTAIEPIKSYIYQPPTIDISEVEPLIDKTRVQQQADALTATNDEPEEETTANSDDETPESAQPVTEAATIVSSAPAKPTINVSEQLNKFSQQQQKQAMQEAFNDENVYRGHSTMHAEPLSVPFRPADKTVPAEQRMSSYSGFDYIQKNDNGTCTLVQDLSHAGAGDWTARQSFGCGESQSDKIKREALEKLVEKVTPAYRKKP